MAPSPPKRSRRMQSNSEATRKSSRLRKSEASTEDKCSSSSPVDPTFSTTDIDHSIPTTSSGKRRSFKATRKSLRLRKNDTEEANTEKNGEYSSSPIELPTSESEYTAPETRNSKWPELAFTQFRDQDILRRMYNLKEKEGKLISIEPEETRRLKRTLPMFTTWRHRTPSPCRDDETTEQYISTWGQYISGWNGEKGNFSFDFAPPTKRAKAEIEPESQEEPVLRCPDSIATWSWMEAAMDEVFEKEQQPRPKPTRKTGCVLLPIEWMIQTCEGILGLPDELIKEVFSLMSRRERVPLTLVCSRFHQLVLECGQNNFETVDMDWESDLQQVDGVMTGDVKFSFLVDTSNRCMETSRDIRMFKKAHVKLLNIKFNGFAEKFDASPPSSSIPSTSSSSSSDSPPSPVRQRINWNRPPNPVVFKLIKDMYFDKVHLVDRRSKRGLAALSPTLFKGITYTQLSAEFNGDADYTALFFQTFIEDRELKNSSVSLSWHRKCNHDTEEVLKLIGKIRSVNSLEIKWRLCGDRMPACNKSEPTMLNDYWLNRLASRSIKANLMAYGDYTASGILKAFEVISESKHKEKSLTLYVKKDVIEELFAMDLSFYEFEKNVKFCFCKYIYDKNRTTELAASFNKIWIKKKPLIVF